MATTTKAATATAAMIPVPSPWIMTLKHFSADPLKLVNRQQYVVSVLA
jgi:hypothetical protein